VFLVVEAHVVEEFCIFLFAGEGGVLVVDGGIGHEHCLEVLRVVFEEVASLKVIQVLLRLNGGGLTVGGRVVTVVIAAVVGVWNVVHHGFGAEEVADAANYPHSRKCAVVVDIDCAVAAKAEDFVGLHGDFVAKTVKKFDGILLHKLLEIG